MNKSSISVTNPFKDKDEESLHFKQGGSSKVKAIKEEVKEKKKKKNLRSGRLIVRNLSFKCNEQSIKDYFSQLGEISEVNLLKKGSKLVGCCFVQYKEKLNAAKAIAKLSGKEFMGRPVVVDWAIPKDKFNKIVKNESEVATEFTVNKENNSASVEEENGVEVKSENGESDDKESEHSHDGLKDSDSEPLMDNEQKQVIVKKEQKDKHKKFHFAYDPKDVSDGRTVFLKNVPFSANDDELLKSAESIGPVVYAVVCIDPLTEHSKGTAFVKFQNQTVVEDLVSGKIKMVLKGVTLEAFIALKKNEVGQKSSKKTPKDNRNLFLLREGIILAGTPAADGVSEGDMAKRLQLEHWKTQQLRNLSKFVSENRLVVHNLPPFLDDNQLQQIFKDNAPKGSVITEARIIRNLNDVDDKGVGRSKGFGFVTFTQHEHALEALRKVNNNPHIFKENKRPIVGFAIENKLALKIKEKRKAKNQNASKQSIIENKTNQSSKIETKKRKHDQVGGEIIPEFCGYIAKPGTKKMRSRKELSVQADLHHKAIIEKKKLKKSIPYSGRRKGKKSFKK